MRASRLCLFFASFVLSGSLALAQSAPQFARDYVYGPGGKLIVAIEPDNYPPAAPGWFSGTPTLCPQLGIELGWAAATDIGSGVASYMLRRQRGAEVDFDVGVLGTSYLDNNLQAYVIYTYFVRGVDRAGHEGSAASFEYSRESCPITNVIPWGSPGAQRPFYAHVRLVELPIAEFRFTPTAWKRIPLVLSPPPRLFSAGGGGAL